MSLRTGLPNVLVRGFGCTYQPYFFAMSMTGPEGNVVKRTGWMWGRNDAQLRMVFLYTNNLSVRLEKLVKRIARGRSI